MAVRGFLQCMLKLFNFVLALMGVLMVVYSLWMLNEWNKEAGGSSSPPSPSSPTSPSPSSPPYPSSPSPSSPSSPSPSSPSPSSPSPSPPSPSPPSPSDDNVTAILTHISAQLPALMASSKHFLSDVSVPAPWFIYAFLGTGIFISLVTFSGAIAAETHSACCLSCIVLAAALFFNKSWDESLPDDPTGQLTKLKEFIQENIDVVKWFGLAVLIVQVIAISLAMILRAMHDGKKKVHEEDIEDPNSTRDPLLPAPPATQS